MDFDGGCEEGGEEEEEEEGGGGGGHSKNMRGCAEHRPAQAVRDKLRKVWRATCSSKTRQSYQLPSVLKCSACDLVRIWEGNSVGKGRTGGGRRLLNRRQCRCDRILYRLQISSSDVIRSSPYPLHRHITPDILEFILQVSMDKGWGDADWLTNSRGWRGAGVFRICEVCSPSGRPYQAAL